MIRKIHREDREAFIRMVEEFYNSEAVLHQIPQEYIHKTFHEVISSSPYAQAFIIEGDNTPAGYGLISLTYSAEAGGLVVLIEELYIRSEFRGLGLGSKFLDYIHAQFAEAKRFRLELTKTNQSAARLYQRKGYKALEYLQMVNDLEA